MSTFITRLPAEAGGARLAVKDAINPAGYVTTGGSRGLAVHTIPAGTDADCLCGARAAGIVIVGKTNLSEICRAPDGINPWFGTPVNPLDLTRIPAACCGALGLSTTHGRISLQRVLPFAPSMDLVGPLARDVNNLLLGTQLLEFGFTLSSRHPQVIG